MNNIQINGQRRWGPPESWSGPPPAHGTEVFVKNLPEQVFELELYATFSAAGPVYEVRLPVNWDGLNRGYAFVRYTSIRAADEAIKIFDGYEIRRNRRIKVARSVDNTRLFLSAVPVDKNADDLKRELSNYVENVKKVYVYPTVENPSLFRGYAFVEFETHRDAAIAKRILTPDICYGLFDKKCVAAWANPLPYLDRSLLKSLNVLFMRNIPKDIKSFHLKKTIENLTAGEEIKRVKKMNNFAFLTFRDHKSAEKALHRLQSIPFLISDHETQVEWAIPREIVSSSCLSSDKEYEASQTPTKRSGCEASKAGDHCGSVHREGLPLIHRFSSDFTLPLLRSQNSCSKSPELLTTQHLTTTRHVVPHVRRGSATRTVESDPTISSLPQRLQPHSKTSFSPSSPADFAAKNDSRKILQTFSCSGGSDMCSVKDDLQDAATTGSVFHRFSDAPYSDITCSVFPRSYGSIENAEGPNFWPANRGESSDFDREDNFFNAISSDNSPYSPYSPISPSPQSPASSRFLEHESDLFSPNMF